MSKPNDDKLLMRVCELTVYGFLMLGIQKYYYGIITSSNILVDTTFLAILAVLKLIWPIEIFNKRYWMQVGCFLMSGFFAWWLVYTAENTRSMYYRLNVQSREIQAMVAGAPFYVVLSDSDGIITCTSSNIELLTGWKPSDLIGQPISVIMLDGQFAKYQITYDKAVDILRNPNQPNNGWIAQGLVKTPLKHKNGNVVPVNMFSGGVRWSTDIQFKGDIDIFAIYFPVDPKDALIQPTNLRFVEGRELQGAPNPPAVKTIVPTPNSVPVTVPRDDDAAQIVKPR